MPTSKCSLPVTGSRFLPAFDLSFSVVKWSLVMWGLVTSHPFSEWDKVYRFPKLSLLVGNIYPLPSPTTFLIPNYYILVELNKQKNELGRWKLRIVAIFLLFLTLWHVLTYKQGDATLASLSILKYGALKWPHRVIRGSKIKGASILFKVCQIVGLDSRIPKM